MKHLATLLAVYLIILSCLPCADAESDAAHPADVKPALADSNGHSDEQHTDLCSPFCVCNCCGVQILNFTPAFSFHSVVIPVLILKPEVTYTAHPASTFSGSIWQPPQSV